MHGRVLSQFSAKLQQEFPLQFKEDDSDRGQGGKALTKLLVAHIRACISKRLSVEAVAATINKAYMEGYYRARQLWALQLGEEAGVGPGPAEGSRKVMNAFLIRQPRGHQREFGPYDDAYGWDGKRITAETLRDNIQVCMPLLQSMRI